MHGHWPVAHALATLALEEIGKAFLCVFAAATPESFRADFWNAFVSHTTKIQVAHVALAPLFAAGTASQSVVQAIEEFGLTAKAGQSAKLRGLYVDYANGTVLNPADVTERDARSVATHVRAAFDALTPVIDDDRLNPDFTAFLATCFTHLGRLIDAPDTDHEVLIQQLWDEVVAGGFNPPWWLPPELFSDDGPSPSPSTIPPSSPQGGQTGHGSV